MNDFEGLLNSDYGYKQQGKSAPMSTLKPSSNTTSPSFNFDLGTNSTFSSSGVQKPLNGGDFDDLFGPPSKSKDEAVVFDSMFDLSSKPPVYDKPVYDDDIFEGVPGIKSFSSSSSGNKYDDFFESVSAPSALNGKDGESSAFDDLLGGFGKANNIPKSKDTSKDEFDDLIPGFGGSSAASERLTPKPTWLADAVTTSRKAMEDPFADLASVSPHVNSSFGVASDPLDNFNNPSKSDESVKADEPSASSRVYDDLDPFDGFPKPVSTSSSDTSSNRKDRSFMQTDQGGHINWDEQVDQISQRDHGSHSNKLSVDNNLELHESFFDMPIDSNSFPEPADHSPSAPYEPYSTEANIPVQEESVGSSDEAWLSVSEIPLFTRPTSAPPPARPPPPRPTRASKVGSVHDFDVPKSAHGDRSATLEDLEAFVMGRSTEYNMNSHVNGFSSEAVGSNLDAAASEAAIEAMDKAEAKFRHDEEVRERESTRGARSRESMQQESDESWLDAEERALREKQERLQKQREEEEKERIRREKEMEREEKEREQRLEKERDRAREERERARKAVERATREARERAAAEARAKAERAAVDKANAEARERAARAAVLRAQSEACERAAAEASARAERAAAEAREREARERATEVRMKAERAEREAVEAREKEEREKAAEARRRAERAAVERAAAEARTRAAAVARDRASAAARDNQQKNDNDLESFFSVPRPKTNPSEYSFDAQFPSKKGPEVARTSAAAASSVRKASPSANFVDDFSSIFGVAPTTSGDFQEIKGETEERRRARVERHQRTQERAAKALAEKNQRDLQAQREQDERHRIGESLDVEIKRWSAGKEGNLRALLSTLQYVLWPECGWQPVSLTDLITGAAVKKAYRKATLCIHPDKVQQKGATLQQKYIAEKVFDLLKEAWNKLNSEELF